MLSRLRRSLRFSNVVALLALFVALGGSSYAALSLPRNSVGSAQLRKNAVTSAKVKDRSLLAKDFRRGQLPAGARGATGATGATGPAGPAGRNGANGTSGRDGTNGRDAPVVDRSTFGQGRSDIAGTVIGSDGDVGVTFRTAGTNFTQLSLTNDRAAGNVIGVFQLYDGTPRPFSANPGQTVTIGDGAVDGLSAGHYSVTVTDQDLARTYRLDCLQSAIGGNRIVRCYGTRSRLG